MQFGCQSLICTNDAAWLAFSFRFLYLYIWCIIALCFRSRYVGLQIPASAVDSVVATIRELHRKQEAALNAPAVIDCIDGPVGPGAASEGTSEEGGGSLPPVSRSRRCQYGVCVLKGMARCVCGTAAEALLLH